MVMRNWIDDRRRMWFVVLLLVTVLLWGCGGGSEEPADPIQEEPPEEASVVEEVEEAAEEPEADEEMMDESQLAALFSGAQEMSELSYEMTISGPAMERMNTLIWLKDQRMRTESEVMGQRMILIYDTDAVYTLDPDEMTAFIMPLSMGMDESMEAITAEDVTSDIDPNDFEYLGTELYQGLECHVVRSTDRATGSQVMMWLHPDLGFPMKVESLSENPEEQYVMEVTNLVMGNVSDEMFQIPEDYEVLDMGSFFQGIPEMPGS